MVPDLTRRRLLGALTGIAGLGSVAAAPRTWYPDPVVDRTIGYRRLPDTETTPPVPAAVLDEGVDALDDYVVRADDLWADVDADRDALPDEARFGRTWLSEARDARDGLTDARATRDSLFDLRRAHGAAGHAIGAGRVVQGETDAEALVERGERMRRAIADVRETLEYRADDPRTDVPTLYWIERALVSAGINTYRGGIYTGGVAPADEYDDRAITMTWRAHLEGEVSLLEATHTRREFDATLEEGTAIADGVDSLYDELRAEVERTRESYDEREAMLEELPEGPYGHARFWLWQSGHGDLDVHGDDGVWGELALLRAIRHARNVLKLRAYPDALERFALEAGEDPDPAHAYRAEREGARRARELIERHDTALFRLVIDDAVRLLRVGDSYLDGGSGSDERARGRATAYVSYHFGDAQLRHAADVYEEVLAHLE